MASTIPTLKDELAAALPEGFHCKIRYVRSSPKPCDALFSPLQGDEPEKTRLASHFLTVSTTPKDTSKDVLFLGIEILVYTTKRLTTIFVSKADSTGYLPQQRPSPVRTIATTFLKWLSTQERSKHPKRKLVISLFARSQTQYLFPGSADNPVKHVLDDRQLIKWWARVLDPIIPSPTSTSTSPEVESVEYTAHLTIPGYTPQELRPFFPPSSPNSTRWHAGDPLSSLARTRGLPEFAPTRCLLPRFPDDPKARFMQDLDTEMGIAEDAVAFASPSKRKTGRWRAVRDLAGFWEAMEFRQECSSGRVVGFLWLVVSSKGDDDVDALEFGSPSRGVSQDLSQESTISRPDAISSSPPSKKKRRRPLTGPIVPRQPRLKGGSSSMSSTSDLTSMLGSKSGDGLVLSKDAYDKAMQKLLHLDFSTLEAATQSTSRWASEVSGREDWAVEIVGTAKVVEPANGTATGDAAVNDLGGIVMKKRKVDDGDVSVSAEEAKPTINVLSAGMIRKKPKPAT